MLCLYAYTSPCNKPARHPAKCNLFESIRHVESVIYQYLVSWQCQ